MHININVVPDIFFIILYSVMYLFYMFFLNETVQIEWSQAPANPDPEVQEEIILEILCSNRLMNLYFFCFSGTSLQHLTSAIGYTEVHCQLLCVQKVDVGDVLDT